MKIEHSVNETMLNKTIGSYAKSKINQNGENLMEFCSLLNLLITNTFFKNKPIHQTTWQSPPSYKTVIDAETKKL